MTVITHEFTDLYNTLDTTSPKHTVPVSFDTDTLTCCVTCSHPNVTVDWMHDHLVIWFYDHCSVAYVTLNDDSPNVATLYIFGKYVDIELPCGLLDLDPEQDIECEAYHIKLADQVNKHIYNQIEFIIN